MEGQKDRTGELEHRLRAIRIDPQDTCAFWTPKEGIFVTVQQCQYCLYGKFGDGNAEMWQSGLCKFRR